MLDQKKKKIGMLHFRVGETDGVSLEMDKWKIVFEQMGYEVIYIAGSGGNITEYIQVKTLHYKHPDNEWLVDVIYKKKINDIREEEVINRLQTYKNSIKKELVQVIKSSQIDVIIANNILSLGWNLAAGLALIEAVQETGIALVGHHHDFHWERKLYSNPKYPWVLDLLNEHFPPKISQAKHVVINSIAQKELKKRGFDSIIVPNVFDFENESIHLCNNGNSLRKKLGINENEIVFLQATRVVQRKGIELIIDVISRLNQELKMMTEKVLYDGRKVNKNTEAILVLVGQNEDINYYNSIITYAISKQVKVKDLSQFFTYEPKLNTEKKEVYSFWDSYVLADFVSYPSLLEGFGNQFLEAVYEKKPLVVYEYPVFCTDLSQYGFSVVSLGSQHEIKKGLVKISEQVIEDSIQNILKVLLDSNVYKEYVNNNYHICLDNFSYKTLKQKLKTLI